MRVDAVVAAQHADDAALCPGGGALVQLALGQHHHRLRPGQVQGHRQPGEACAHDDHGIGGSTVGWAHGGQGEGSCILSTPRDPRVGAGRDTTVKTSTCHPHDGTAGATFRTPTLTLRRRTSNRHENHELHPPPFGGAPDTPEAGRPPGADGARDPGHASRRGRHRPPSRREIGRPVGANERELFVSCAPAEALQQQIDHLDPEFIAVHDIGTTSSRRLLAGIAAAGKRAVQKLHIRRQGYGTTLATLEYVELPTSDGSRLLMYSTEADADTASRHDLARTLLANSRLSVIMVGELPSHTLEAAFKPLHADILGGHWRNRHVLVLPLSGASTVATRRPSWPRQRGRRAHHAAGDAPGRCLGLHQRHLGAHPRAAAGTRQRAGGRSPEWIPAGRRAGTASRTAAGGHHAAAGDAPHAGGAHQPPAQRRAAAFGQPARPLRAPARRTHRHGELLRVRARQRQPRWRMPVPARAPTTWRTTAPNCSPRSPAPAARWAWATRFPMRRSRSARTTCCARCPAPGPGAARGARQDARQPDAGTPAGAAHGRDLRRARGLNHGLVGVVSERPARSGTRRPPRPPGSRPSARSGLPGSAWPPGSRCAAGWRA